jgi:hypothetical protein
MFLPPEMSRRQTNRNEEMWVVLAIVMKLKLANSSGRPSDKRSGGKIEKV